MSKTVDLAIPQTAAERIAAQGAPVRPVSPQWLEGLCAHVDEDGLIGEPAAKALLNEVLNLRALLANLSNEVLGSLPLMEPLARRELGNSNYVILIQRAEEARALTAQTQETGGEGNDIDCHDLADSFLQEMPHLWTTRRTDELAAMIHRTVSDYIASEQSNYEPPDPPGWEGGFADNH